MAGVTPRALLVAFPAIITLLTFLWVRKKKKSNIEKKAAQQSSNGQVLPEKITEISETVSIMGENETRSNESNSALGLVSSLNELSLNEEDLSEVQPQNDATSIIEEVIEKVESIVETAEPSIMKGANYEDPENILELSELNISHRNSLSKSSRSEDQESSNADVFPELDDMIESPPPSIYSDAHSEDSSDSGKGGSDIQGSNSNYDFSSSSPLSSSEDPQQVQVYEFELAPDLCGRLIGRMGKHVNYMKSRTNANVFIKRHPFNPNMKICSVEGTKEEIKGALEMVRKRFPPSQYNSPSLVQVNLPLTCGVMVPETLQLNLPIGVTCDVILSSMVSAGHFFVQQPTHPTYPSLSRLDLCMSACYSQIDTPPMPQPVEVGVICAAPTMGGWYRAQVVNIYDNSEDCDIKFVDYGGYSCIPLNSLRQIRSDFMTLPFQASECYLANVKPVEGEKSSGENGGWSLESCGTFEELAQGQILQALVVDHADDSVPFVHLYRVQGVSTVFINRELVNRGVSQWVEYRQE